MKPILIILKEGYFHIPNLKDLGGKYLEKAQKLLKKPNIANFTRFINQTTIEVKKLPIVIGKSEEANVIMSPVDRDVSRTHAEIFEEHSELKIRDLASKFGTIVIKQQQNPIRLVNDHGVKLEDNDVIQLGKHVKLQISFEGPGIFSRIKSWFT